ncbi:MAG: hypothetical protein IJH28_02390 [Mogibacterium sp.]|nr:hypothetical protein [Mogibacterium sp.]MBQ6501514.1 hypothetical protein [Mogibacterium sp.]
MDVLRQTKRALAVILVAVMVLSLSFTDVHAASSKVWLTSYNTPTTVSMGHSYSIKGWIKASKKIYSVEIGIANADTEQWEYKYTKYKINSKSFNIKKADLTLKFGNLSPGTYYYRIHVKLKGEKYVNVLNKKFTVVDQTASTVDLTAADNTGISLSGANAPDTYTVGKEFKPKGTVSSTSKIKKVEVGIVFSATNKWTDYKYTANVNTYNFDLSKTASTLKFDKIPAGAYRYRMYAHTEDGIKIVFNKSFTVRASNKPQQAVNWAVNIANDNSFSYGKKPETSRLGCYFCGTNQKRKPKGYEKTYVCLTFLGAAYAHGAKDPEILKACQNCKMVMYSNNDNFSKFSCWMKIGSCKELAIGDLLPGDVIVDWSAGNNNGHVWMFVGGDKFVDAEGIADCWGANSIAVRSGAARKLAAEGRDSSLNYVMRYIH